MKKAEVLGIYYGYPQCCIEAIANLKTKIKTAEDKIEQHVNELMVSE